MDAPVARVSLSFSSSTLVLSDGKSLSYTAYCPTDHVRVTAGADSLLPVACERCPLGWRSKGGTSHECAPCSGMMCVGESQSLFKTSFVVDASSEQISHGDRLLVEIVARTSAANSPQQALGRSQVVTVDLTPPTALLHDQRGTWTCGLQLLRGACTHVWPAHTGLWQCLRFEVEVEYSDAQPLTPARFLLNTPRAPNVLLTPQDFGKRPM